jgi:hypothetical protein
VSSVVLGIATSHSPLLANPAEAWLERAQDDTRSAALNLSDGRRIPYSQLLAEVGERHAEHATLACLQEQELRAGRALGRLAQDINSAAPDLAVIVGDDQGELFARANMPAVSVYYGAELVMHPFPTGNGSPRWLQNAVRGYGMDRPHRYPAAPEVALPLIEGLMDAGIDVGAAAQIEDPAHAGFGHAFGFIIERLFAGRPLPVLPVLINTYYPPNVPRPGRCYDIGRTLRSVLEPLSAGRRVAIIASGGLSHFVTDEALDRAVLAAIASGDETYLRSLPMAALQDGSSEILCWVLAAGALQGLPLSWSEYVPVYRTPAGSGIGLAFAAWHA